MTVLELRALAVFFRTACREVEMDWEATLSDHAEAWDALQNDLSLDQRDILHHQLEGAEAMAFACGMRWGAKLVTQLQEECLLRKA